MLLANQRHSINPGDSKEMILSRFLKCQPEELVGNEKKLFDAILKIADERDYYKKKYEELKEYYKSMRDCDEEFEL